jgi:hypothetical protein
MAFPLAKHPLLAGVESLRVVDAAGIPPGTTTADRREKPGRTAERSPTGPPQQRVEDVIDL